MSFDSWTGVVGARASVRERPRDGCGVDLVAIDSFVAEEGQAEVEIITWSCPRCGARLETADRAPGLDRSVA